MNVLETLDMLSKVSRSFRISYEELLFNLWKLLHQCIIYSHINVANWVLELICENTRSRFP